MRPRHYQSWERDVAATMPAWTERRRRPFGGDNCSAGRRFGINSAHEAAVAAYRRHFHHKPTEKHMKPWR